MKNSFLLFLFWLFLFFAEQQGVSSIVFVRGISFVILIYAFFHLKTNQIILLVAPVFFVRSVFCASTFLVFIELATLLILRFFVSLASDRRMILEAFLTVAGVFLSQLLFLFLSPEHQLDIHFFHFTGFVHLFFSSLLILWLLNVPAAFIEEKYFSFGSPKAQLQLFQARDLYKRQRRRPFNSKKNW